jgi:hypothetical protein
MQRKHSIDRHRGRQVVNGSFADIGGDEMDFVIRRRLDRAVGIEVNRGVENSAAKQIAGRRDIRATTGEAEP